MNNKSLYLYKSSMIICYFLISAILQYMLNKRRFIWEDRYSVGIIEIDDQHKKLFETMNELLDGLRRHISEQHLAKITRDLIEYKKQHFLTEEKYFDLFQYPDRDTHVAKHLEFSKRLEELNTSSIQFTVEYGYELVEFLESWFAEHVLYADQQYKDCFHRHGL